MLYALALALALAATLAAADAWLEKPVDDSTFQTYLEFFAVDSELPLAVEVSEPEVEEGVKRERLTFQSSRGEHVPAYFFSADVDDGRPRPGLIFLRPTRGKSSRGIQLMAPMMVRAGWNVLAPDLKHFGERDSGLLTTFTEKEKHAALYNEPSVYLEWVVQTVKDVRRGYDFLVNERNTDPERIALAGHSRGAIVGIVAGGAEPRFAAVVSLFGGHFDALEREHLPAACPANYVGRISPRPLLMINGTHDADLVKDTSVLPIFELAREPKTIHWEDRGHGGMRDETRSFILDWLRENVQ